MAVDRKFIGKAYPAITYEVGKEKLKEYAWGTDDPNPIYREEEKAKEAGFDKLPAAPLFAVVYASGILRQILLDPELKLNLPMLVHGSQDFTFRKMVEPGDVITTQGKIADIYDKQSKSGKNLDFVVVESESKNQKGELVCTGRWTFIIRG